MRTLTPCLAVLEIIRSFRGLEFFDLCLRDLIAQGIVCIGYSKLRPVALTSLGSL